MKKKTGIDRRTFIAGEVGLHYATSIEKRGGKAFVTTVNDQIHQAVASLPRAGCVSANGLKPGSDGIHFTTESAHELGRRYAVALKRLASGGRRSLGRVKVSEPGR